MSGFSVFVDANHGGQVWKMVQSHHAIEKAAEKKIWLFESSFRILFAIPLWPDALRFLS